MGIVLPLSSHVRLWPVNYEWMTCVISEAMSLLRVPARLGKPQAGPAAMAKPEREGWSHGCLH